MLWYTKRSCTYSFKQRHPTPVLWLAHLSAPLLVHLFTGLVFIGCHRRQRDEPGLCLEVLPLYSGEADEQRHRWPTFNVSVLSEGVGGESSKRGLRGSTWGRGETLHWRGSVRGEGTLTDSWPSKEREGLQESILVKKKRSSQNTLAREHGYLEKVHSSGMSCPYLRL